MTVITPTPDLTNPVAARLDELTTCLCAEIEASEVPPVCFCGQIGGDNAAWDYSSDCGDGACGMAWVRLTNAYPSTIVGAPNLGLANCGSVMGFDVELGILRCAPPPDSQGNPPTAQAQTEAAALAIADMWLMRRAVNCCRDSKNWIMGTYVPVGPQGGVVGGLWTVSMQEF